MTAETPPNRKTVSDDDTELVRAINAGAVAFLTKPLDVGSLLDAIGLAITGGRATPDGGELRTDGTG